MAHHISATNAVLRSLRHCITRGPVIAGGEETTEEYIAKFQRAFNSTTAPTSQPQLQVQVCTLAYMMVTSNN